MIRHLLPETMNAATVDRLSTQLQSEGWAEHAPAPAPRVDVATEAALLVERARLREAMDVTERDSAATTPRFRAIRRELGWYVHDTKTDSRIGFATSAERAAAKARELNKREA